MKSKLDMFDVFYFVGTAFIAAGSYFVQPYYPFFVAGISFIYVGFARGKP